MGKTLAEKKEAGLVYYEINGTNYYPEALLNSLTKKNRQQSADIKALREAAVAVNEWRVCKESGVDKETCDALEKQMVAIVFNVLIATDPNREMENK